MAQAQGSKGLLSIQYEDSYGATPATPDMTKVYFESEGFKASKNLITSQSISGTRHSTTPIAGNIDTQGSIAAELQVGIGTLLNAALGSIKTTLTSGSETTTGSATISACSSTLGAVAASQTMILTLVPTSHLFVIGDTLLLGAGATINAVDVSTYRFRVVAQSSGSVTVRVPLGLAGELVVTPGNVKKVAAGGGGTAYTHEFKSGGILPSVLVEKAFTDLATPQYLTYSGCKVSKLSLNVAPEGFQKISFDFVGKQETISTSPFDSTITDLLKKSFSGGEISGILENGGATTTVTKIDLSLDNSLDTGIYCLAGAGKRSDIPIGTTKVTGTLEVLFDSITLYQKAIDSTESTLKITYTKGTGAGTLGNELLEIFLPELIFKQDTPVIGGDKGVLVTLPFETFYDNNADATQLKITLKCPQLSL